MFRFQLARLQAQRNQYLLIGEFYSSHQALFADRIEVNKRTSLRTLHSNSASSVCVRAKDLSCDNIDHSWYITPLHALECSAPVHYKPLHALQCFAPVHYMPLHALQCSSYTLLHALQFSAPATTRHCLHCTCDYTPLHALHQ